MGGPMTPTIALIVPVYGNAATLLSLAERLAVAMTGRRWRLRFVIDASPDSSAEVATGLAARDARIATTVLTANVGQHRALERGLAAEPDADVGLPRRRPAGPTRSRTGAAGPAGVRDVAAVFAGRRGAYEPRLRRWSGDLHRRIVARLTGLLPMPGRSSLSGPRRAARSSRRVRRVWWWLSALLGSRSRACRFRDRRARSADLPGPQRRAPGTRSVAWPGPSGDAASAPTAARRSPSPFPESRSPPRPASGHPEEPRRRHRGATHRPPAGVPATRDPHRRADHPAESACQQQAEVRHVDRSGRVPGLSDDLPRPPARLDADARTAGPPPRRRARGGRCSTGATATADDVTSATTSGSAIRRGHATAPAARAQRGRAARAAGSAACIRAARRFRPG